MPELMPWEMEWKSGKSAKGSGGGKPWEDYGPKGISKATPQDKETSDFEKAVNLGAAYVHGRTWGAGPKIAAAIGAPISKAVLEGVEAFTGKEAPTLKELYSMGVETYTKPVKQAREDTPALALSAEILGGGKSALQFGRSQLGKQATGLSGRVSGVLQKMGVGARTSGVLGKTGVGGVLAETAARSYGAAEAPVGEEAEEFTKPGVPIAGGIGAVLPVAGAGASLIKRKATPAIEEGTRKAAEIAQKYDIPLGIENITGNQAYKTFIDALKKLPLPGAGKLKQNQQKAFNRAVAKTIGQDADSLSPEVISKAYDDIGKQFDSFSKGKTFTIDEPAMAAIDDLRALAERGNYGSDGVKFLAKNLDDFLKLAQDGKISGKNISRIRAKYNKFRRTTKDPNTSEIAGDLENLVIDIITDSSPIARKRLTQAKYQYKNLKVIEPLAMKEQVGGNISPAQLTSRMKAVYKTEFAKGKAGELGDLARVGQLIKQTIPDSATAQRSLTYELMFGAGAAGAGGYYGGLEGVAAGIAVPAVLGTAALAYSRNPKAIEKMLRNKKSLVPYGQKLGTQSPLIGGAVGILNR